jgi:hypothetical protein
MSLRALGLALVITATGTNGVLGCSCSRSVSAVDIMADATAVFTGVAERTRPDGDNRSITTFKVIESFKGASRGARVEVSHRSGSPASCGVRFDIGATHTLSAHWSEEAGMLTASSCSCWMFFPHVGMRDQLLKEMRALARGTGGRSH